MLNENRFDVVALGELLIDFTDNGLSGQGNTLFEANPGGAPCNVLAMLKKLGRQCAFVGKVGDDLLGRQLRDVVAAAGVDVSHLMIDPEHRTTLAFVKTLKGGDREFSFFRNPGADMMLTQEEIPETTVSNCRVFHYGTLSMTHEGVRKATRKAVECAQDGGALLSFDPNLRPPLWGSMEEAREQMAYGFAHCNILKIADNELHFYTGETDPDRGAAMLQRRYSCIKLVNVTMGAQGSYSYYKGTRAFRPATDFGGTIETTGAGDTFCACVIDYVLNHGLDGLTQEQLEEMLTFANTAAYIVTTKKGAIRSMPERNQIEELVKMVR